MGVKLLECIVLWLFDYTRTISRMMYTKIKSYKSILIKTLFDFEDPVIDKKKIISMSVTQKRSNNHFNMKQHSSAVHQGKAQLFPACEGTETIFLRILVFTI